MKEYTHTTILQAYLVCGKIIVVLPDIDWPDSEKVEALAQGRPCLVLTNLFFWVLSERSTPAGQSALSVAAC